MKIPGDLYYSKEHIWLENWQKKTKMGITDYAQQRLGEVVYIELEETGKELEKGQVFGIVESIKSVSQLYMPCQGKIVTLNKRILDDPELVNQDPYQNGWLIEINIISKDKVVFLSDREYEDYIQ